MEFQTLSHAGLRVSASGAQLLCDPWLVGSVYWRSWWNYPPVPRALVDTLKPDFIYLTHLHWDHFQAASLRLFPDDVPVLVPYDRYGRMTRDLKAVGRTNVREIRHGERVVLRDGLAITPFHISPIITDSALLIEAEDQVLLNANDAKFAGMPLSQILSRVPKVDFCFRSHSSANPRSNYHVTDAPAAEHADDNEHYVRAFALFMARVKPRYAIPFASNNCFLHDDVFALNAQAQTPIAVRDYFEEFAKERGLDTQIRVMIPGDRWSPDTGFQLQEHDWFENRDQRLAEYRERVAPTMAKQAALEGRVKVPLRALETFFAKAARDVPGLLMRPLKGREVLLAAKTGDRVEGFAVNLPAGTVRRVEEDDFDAFDMRIDLPALILRQAATMNMFGHAAISKRIHFHATAAAMPALKRFVSILEMVEAEVFPLRGHFTARALRAALPRWREGVLYARVAADLARGADLPSLEERYLDPVAA